MFGPVVGPNNGSPVLREYTADGSADFLPGAVLILSSGLVTAAGTNPGAGTILGVAMAAEDSAPGYNVANSPDIVATTWRKKTLSVALANGNIFKGKLTNGSATLIAPVQADVGASYGITAYSGIWRVDKNKTTTDARVVIIKIDTDVNEVYFRFIESFTVTV